MIAGRPAPTHRNVAYGPHERNAIDVWLAESARPTPLVLYVDGGEFRGGSKESLSPQPLRSRVLLHPLKGVAA